jgi:hypothetical protein
MTGMANQELSNMVRKAIEEARATGHLSLIRLGLEKFPDEILQQTMLRRLVLVGNRLRVIPSAIRNLRRLEELDLRGNPIEHVPDIPGLLLDGETYLRVQQLVSRENVRGLDIIRSDDRVIIEHLGTFPNLTDLLIQDELIDQVPLGLRGLSGLQNLVVSMPCLRDLPTWVDEWHRLRHLTFWGHGFSRMPEPLFRLASLEILDLEPGRFKIKEIPPEILNLTRLKELRIDPEFIQTPPLEVVRQGVDAIKTYWRQRQDSDVDYLCEAKLLILSGSCARGSPTCESPTASISPIIGGWRMRSAQSVRKCSVSRTSGPSCRPRGAVSAKSWRATRVTTSHRSTTSTFAGSTASRGPKTNWC